MLIYQNSVIELMDLDFKVEQIVRVLWISPDYDLIYVVNIEDHKNMGYPYSLKYKELLIELEDNRARILKGEPDLRLISPEEEYLKKYKKNRDANWEVIKDIVAEEPAIYHSKYRGPLVEETRERTGRSKKEIYRLLKRYWFYGKTKNALLNNYFNCGVTTKPKQYKKNPGPKPKDKNGWILTERDKEIFKKAIKKFHIEQKMNLTATHQHLCEEWYHTGYFREHGVMVPIVEADKTPSFRQFMYWYNKEYSYMEKYSNKKGKRKAEMEIRYMDGDSTERALSTGYLYEIDSTPADIILVAEDRRTIIGTPTLYIVKDVFSRMIVGFHASLSPASKIEIMVSMVNTASDKVEFCKQYGIHIDESDWPCKNLPLYLAGDRGELKSRWAENLVNIKVDVDNAPSYRGDLKPFVEQHFRLTNDEIRELLYRVGAKPPKMIERGDEDPKRKAALTIYEFTQFMIIQILTFNKSALPKNFLVTKEMFEDKVELTPLGIWKWKEGSSLFHEEPRDLLVYNLLPKGQATITRGGIKFSDMCYTCDKGIKNGWFIECEIDGKKEIEISYDPRNVSSIFIRLKCGKIEQCFLTNKYNEYEGLHLEDIKAIIKYKKDQIKRLEKAEKQHKAVLHVFADELVENALTKTQDANQGISFGERQKNRRETKKNESRIVGSVNALTTTRTEIKESQKVSEKAEVVAFPFENRETTFRNEVHIQKVFEEKSKKGRRSRGRME
ncbi:Mu transposase C-terminal domain-containing protein [Falsibacillus pallidus]|uniref:Mu transposase-like protein n=1 Tax=Falsibacillus pallidus TaxID=493781 RepID=A0A370G659_9BACI|nr:Mu transposase C-terminal domain-containing protein [Falsibacillus pallidus]RDI37523.1 Mu transposase-like protein [Falsibacillus pallidus]